MKTSLQSKSRDHDAQGKGCSTTNAALDQTEGEKEIPAQGGRKPQLSKSIENTDRSIVTKCHKESELSEPSREHAFRAHEASSESNFDCSVAATPRDSALHEHGQRSALQIKLAGATLYVYLRFADMGRDSLV
jgi:hypothetical protein